MEVYDGFMIKLVEAFVVQAGIPFVMGMDTLQQWGALIDMYTKEISFRPKINKTGSGKMEKK